MKNLKVLVASMALMATSAVFAGQEISGKQLLLKDSTVGVSGLWNWITVSDNLDIGTEIVPARGTSPLFAKEDGSISKLGKIENGRIVGISNPTPSSNSDSGKGALVFFLVAFIIATIIL